MDDSANAEFVPRAPAARPLSPAQASKANWPPWIALGTGLAAMLLLFVIWPYQHWQYAQRESVMKGWWKVVGESFNGEWMFCYLVPLLAGFLVYLRRDQLRKLPLAGSWWGTAVVAAGLFIYWVGYKADTGYAGFLAAQAVIAGLVILLGGWGWMRALLFPWLFLTFMWPMFPIEERLVMHLRLFTAGVSEQFLNLIGVPTVREGTALSSAADAAKGLSQGHVFRLDVEEPCSGVRSLYSLLMVSALYGYLSLKNTLPRLVLFASAMPLAMAGNFVRMVLLALGSIWFGSDIAVGRNINGQQEMSLYHTLCGYAVFAVALAGMFGLCSVLERKHWKSLKNFGKRASGPAATQPVAFPRENARRVLTHSAAALALAAGGIGICAATNTQPHLAEPGVVLRLPLQLGRYQGTPHDMTALERNILDEGVELVRTVYMSPDQRMLMGTVIQSGYGKRTLHRPEVCLPGQGWTITDRVPVPIRLADGTTLTATMLRMFREFEKAPGQFARMRAVSCYWYIGSDGTTSPDYYDHIRISYIDAVFKNLGHRWAMAMFFAPLPESENGPGDPFAEASALEDLRDLASQAAAEFMKPRNAIAKSAPGGPAP